MSIPRQKQASLKPRVLITVYIIASCYRLINAFFIQTQFDPDEYWQTLEPAYCLAFNNSNGSHSHGNNCAYTWEWTRRLSATSSSMIDNNNKRYSNNINSIIISFFTHALHGPVRSYVSILPTYWFYKLFIILYESSWSLESIRLLSSSSSSSFCTYMIAHGPIFWNALFITAPTDVATYYIATWMTRIEKKKDYSTFSTIIPYLAFILSLTNWFHGYALIRTYSNSLETMLLLVGIALLSPELFGTTTSIIPPPSGSTANGTRIKANIAFILGGLSVVIRFTSLAAWIPIGIIVSYRLSSSYTTHEYMSATGTSRSNKNRKNNRNFLWYIFHLCALYGGLGVLVGCIVDWYYYTTLSSSLGNVHGTGDNGGSNFVLPFLGNFHFNVLLGNGSLYGTHPSYWYIIAGLPAISGILLPFFVYEMYKTISFNFYDNIISIQKSNKQTFKELQQNDSSTKISTQQPLRICPKLTLIIIIISYISFHSISSHKEFRFILPILPLVCILSSFPISRYINMENSSNKDNNDNDNDREKELVLATIQRGRWKVVIVLLYVFNYPHLFFLGMIHQRAPISVNQVIASHIYKINAASQNDKQHENDHEIRHRYSIHYLMGCHSTPLYSHLHVPIRIRSNKGSHSNIRIATELETWTLDCSPNCRKDSSCESDEFAIHPYRFIMKSYYNVYNGNEYHYLPSQNGSPLQKDIEECQVMNNSNSVGGEIIVNESCSMHRTDKSHTNNDKMKSIPDFLVIFDNDLSSVENTMTTKTNTIETVKDVIEKKMGLHEIGKLRHSINSVEFKLTSRHYYRGNNDDTLTLGTTTTGTMPLWTKYVHWTEEGVLKLDIFGIGIIQVFFDHIVLYTRIDTL